MAVKIMIDAGHGGYDAGATYNGRKEKDDVLALALAVGEILSSQGYDVEYTRTEDVYDSPVQKARIANESGADFFVSLHRNSSPNPNQYNGVQTLVYNDSGIKAEMARNVNDQLEQVGYRNINVVERPNLAVLRRTRMPAILVEAGFINSDVDNALFDSRFSETAEAIAAGIDETLREAGYVTAVAGDAAPVSNDHYGIDMAVPVSAMQTVNSQMQNPEPADQKPQNVQPDETKTPNPKMPDAGAKNQEYQILVGIYRTFGAASYQANRFIRDGYDAEVFEDEGLYQVRIGTFSDIEDALIAQRELRDKGFDTLIVRKGLF